MSEGAFPFEYGQALLLDHLRRPRNRSKGSDEIRVGRATNPHCGDVVEISVSNPRGELMFWGQGCPISQATASVITVVAQDWDPTDVVALRRLMEGLLKEDSPIEPRDQRRLGDLMALATVGKVRRKTQCVLMSFDALLAALNQPHP